MRSCVDGAHGSPKARWRCGAGRAAFSTDTESAVLVVLARGKSDRPSDLIGRLLSSSLRPFFPFGSLKNAFPIALQLWTQRLREACVCADIPQGSLANGAIPRLGLKKPEQPGLPAPFVVCQVSFEPYPYNTFEFGFTTVCFVQSDPPTGHISLAPTTEFATTAVQVAKPRRKQVDQLDGLEDSEGESLGSDDDDNDDQDAAAAAEENPNTLHCQFEKVKKVRGKWHLILTDGVMSVNGRDHIFKKATGDLSW
eukprot:m.101331 g.101331  ORF g.101331 m.101331 type:complete len:253 (-) comp51485_c0_seq2:729-1487(-)